MTKSVYVRLDALEDLKAGDRKAAIAVGEYLKAKGEFTSDCYIVEILDEGDCRVFSLCDKEGLGKEILGNPTGKCRDVCYDTKEGKVVKQVFWR